MPNILKTKCIILRTFPFKESSLFVSALSKDLGKLNLLAKGARRPKSKLCGTLEPFNHSEIIFYKREFKDTCTLSDAVIIDDFEAMRKSPVKLAACEAVCEFIDKTQTIEEPNPKIYYLFLTFLNELSLAKDEMTSFWTTIMLFRLLKFAGFEPHLSDCVVCHKSIINGAFLFFSIARGGLVCETHFDESVIKLSNHTIELVLNAHKDPFPDKIDLHNFSELGRLFESFIYYHLGGLKLNSLRFIL
ncbi:MAG: DNA repair protein RecO [bacterium]